MLTLTEETILIPAGSVACMCPSCDRVVVYFVPRLSGCRMPVEIASDEHQHPRVDQDGIGRAHLPHCHAGRK